MKRNANAHPKKNVSYEKLKILILTAEYPPKVGGAGHVAQHNAEILSKAGYMVDVVTLAQSGLSESENYHLFPVKKLPFVFPVQLALQAKKLKLETYRTIIINDPGAAIAASFFFPEDIQKKCLVWMHGDEIHSLYLNAKKSFRMIQFPKRYAELLNNCKMIVCQSHFLKKQAQEAALPSLIPDKFHVVTNGVDQKNFFPEYFDIRGKYGLSSNSCIIFSASRIVRHKGYETMFDIIKQLLDEGEPVTWIIAGDGNYLEELKEQTSLNGFDRNIIFTGSLSPSEMRKYYSSADVFMLLSEYESYGLVYLESLLCDTPVIGKDMGGVGEIVKNGTNGFLIQNSQECYRILKEKRYLQINKDMIRNSIPNTDVQQRKLLEIC